MTHAPFCISLRERPARRCWPTAVHDVRIVEGLRIVADPKGAGRAGHSSGRLERRGRRYGNRRSHHRRRSPRREQAHRCAPRPSPIRWPKVCSPPAPALVRLSHNSFLHNHGFESRRARWRAALAQWQRLRQEHARTGAPAHGVDPMDRPPRAEFPAGCEARTTRAARGRASHDRPRRPAHRQVRNPPQAGARRHGGRVPGRGHRDRPRGGAEADRAQRRRRHAIDAIEAERRGAELQARLAEVDRAWSRVYDAGDMDGITSTSPWSTSTGRTWPS
jgi:hypothetical protein